MTGNIALDAFLFGLISALSLPPRALMVLIRIPERGVLAGFLATLLFKVTGG